MLGHETATAAPGTARTTGRDEVFQVEEHGIDPIPDAERHGSAKDVF
ncbi:hypothetical protein [Streptomyces cinereoruber]